MVEMEADTPVAAASSDDAPRSAPGGSADAPPPYHAMDGSLSFLTHNPTSCLLFES